MKAFEIAGVPRDEVHRFVRGLHSDPFSVLGPHKVGDDVEIRVFCPDARAVEIVLDREPDKPMPAERIDEEGFFCATVPGADRDIPYQLRIVKLDGSEELMRDAYQYGPIMGDVDLHLFSEGQHWKIYEKFGAHLRTIGDATGVYFAVWAPNAQRVSVVGDFNDWDGRVNPMRKLLNAGVWELFLPEIKQGAHYKFEIRTQTDAVLLKSDPFAFFNQHGKSDSIAGLRFGALSLERRRLDGSAPEKELAAKSDQRLRGAPRLMASQRRKSAAYLSRTGGHVAAVRVGDGLHAHRNVARCRTSVRRLVGLSSYKLLRAYQQVRTARMICVISSINVIRPASA